MTQNFVTKQQKGADNIINNKYNRSISIRCDNKMNKMLKELEEKLLLNTTSVMRLALVTLYKEKINKGDL